MNYIISTGTIERIAHNWADAKRIATKYREYDPVIDQYDEEGYTGTQWFFVGSKLVKDAA
jgi:hypothetical protein